jgi:hypothetical protein
MSDGVLIAIIGGLFALTTTVLQVLQRRAVHAIRDQVENDHAGNPAKVTNLREDMDEKHNILVTILRRDVGGIRQDVRTIRNDISALAERVTDVEREQLEQTKDKLRKGTS